jgi:hypothetical protein
MHEQIFLNSKCEDVQKVVQMSSGRHKFKAQDHSQWSKAAQMSIEFQRKWRQRVNFDCYLCLSVYKYLFRSQKMISTCLDKMPIDDGH